MIRLKNIKENSPGEFAGKGSGGNFLGKCPWENFQGECLRNFFRVRGMSREIIHGKVNTQADTQTDSFDQLYY